MEKNLTITITGPSGIGKGYLKRYLKNRFNLEEIVVYTTRDLREDEGSDERIWLSEEDFQCKLDNGELALVNELFGHRYAFEANYLRRLKQRSGRFIAELYIDNVKEFRNMFPSVNMIALVTESIKFLEHRLKKRSDTDDLISVRLKNAEFEIQKILKNKNMFNLVYMVNENTENRVLNDIATYIERLYIL